MCSFFSIGFFKISFEFGTELKIFAQRLITFSFNLLRLIKQPNVTKPFFAAGVRSIFFTSKLGLLRQTQIFGKHKIFSVFCYFVFSLPCIYIIILWGGLVQESVVQARGFGEEFNYSHIGYSSTMICFYLMPLLFFKGEKLLSLVKNFFLDKKNYYLISLFFVYFFFLSNNLLFSEEALLERGYLHGGSIFFDEPISIGKGYIHKLSIILFNDEFFRTIFTYLSFFFSWLVILIYLNRNFKDLSNTIKHYETLSNILEHYQTFWNTIKHFGTLSKILEHYQRF